MDPELDSIPAEITSQAELSNFEYEKTAVYPAVKTFAQLCDVDLVVPYGPKIVMS